jgi:amino acid adenylation domain-containing protein
MAARLRRNGVGAGSIVGLCAQPSAGLIIALLGILSAGAAFVGIDPDMPVGRTQFMLRRSGTNLLIVDDPGYSLPEWNGRAITISELAEPVGSTVPLPEVGVRGLAYVLFTSGSTGRPKGVAVPHAALANYVTWAAAAYQLRAADKSIVHGSVGFDLMLTSIFPALSAGQTLVMAGPGHGLAPLIAVLQRCGPVGLLKLTPSHLRALNALLTERPQVHALVAGGEQLSYRDVRGWLHAGEDTHIFNEYGPTEATIGCCVHQIGHDVPGKGLVPIGTPIANTHIFVLDEDLRPTAPGAVGEIYIGGSCLAVGYFEEPSLTAEKFIPDSITGEDGERLYRTGDLGLVLDNGELSFCGRRDDQIKIRGFRVEPAEIVAVLTSYPACREAVVIKGPGDQLLAFAVPTGRPADVRDLYRFARARLPSYLVPDLITWVDQIPVTLNGKADTAALLSGLNAERTSLAWRI